MSVFTLKRMAVGGVRELRGLEKHELPGAIKRARLDHGIDWLMDVRDLSLVVETKVAPLPDDGALPHPPHGAPHGCRSTAGSWTPACRSF